MQFIRDIRIEIAFIVFSIIISSSFSLEIEVFNKAKNISEKHDLFEYIEKGKITMLENSRRCKIEKKAIMVLGLTGTGKTTLINYLNGVPLVGMKKGRSWRVNLKNESHTLPCGFEIGHNAHSQTHLPSAYTPPDSDFSYLDNPGFKDTGGLEYGIVNAFFRNEITENIDEFKFLLLVTPNGLDERGQQFRDSMEGFSEFLEVFDSEKAEGLSKSIGIVVARVENKIGESDEEVKEGLRDQLLEILNDIKKSAQKRLSDCGSDIKCQWQIKNRELVFRRVIEDLQVEIFSSPTSNATLDDTQKNQILKMIDSLQYVKKNDTVANKTLGFRVVVNKEFIVKALVRNLQP
jgi:energy-coupling factor transporter ATP-binding protein EcfA2